MFRGMTGGELISFVCTAVLKFVIREELTPATRTRGMTAYGRLAVNETQTWSWRCTRIVGHAFIHSVDAAVHHHAARSLSSHKCRRGVSRVDAACRLLECRDVLKRTRVYKSSRHSIKVQCGRIEE